MSVLSLAGCQVDSGEPLGDTPSDLRNRTQNSSATTQLISFQLPRGPGLGQLALVATNTLRLEDRVTVFDPDNVPAALANSGTGPTTLGIDSRTGSVRSVGPLEVRDRGAVAGDALSSGTITLRTGATVSGTKTPNSTGLTPTVSESLEIELGGVARGGLDLNAPNGSAERVTNLLPGVYTTVNVRSRNRVNLVSGNYVFNELHLEPQTRLVIDDANGPVFINIKTAFSYKSKIESVSGAHPALRVVYLGTNLVVVEQSFTGTLLAPNAALRFATASPPPTHIGSFFAKSIEVSPDVKIVFRPYLTYDAEQEWEVPAAGPGGFGLAVPTADGSVVAKTTDNVILTSSTGSVTNLLAPGRRRFRVDESSGEFGYYSPNTLESFSQTGTFAGSLPMTVPGSVAFVPGSSAVLLIQGKGEHDRSEWTGFRLAASGNLGPVVATPGMMEFVAGPSEFVYTTKTELVCVSLSGVQRWRVPRPLIRMALSENGQTLVGAYANNGPKFVHISMTTGAVSAPVALPSAPYSLDVSPSGAFASVALKNRVLIFQNGAQKRGIDLPFAHFASSDLSDKGELLVGGADSAGRTLLQLIGDTGTGFWLEEPGPIDQGAYRPHVRFRPGGNDFVVVRASGLSSYRTTKGL